MPEVESRHFQLNRGQFQLDGLEAKLTNMDLESHAFESQEAFEQTLPALSETIARARKQRVTVSQSVVDNLQQKLFDTGADAKGYWPAVSEFITYRSIVALPAQSRNLTSKPLQDCTDFAPTPGTIESVQNPHQATLAPSVYKNCRFKIDSEKQDKRINEMLRNGYPTIKFDDCLIEYSGGQIDLIVAWNKVSETFTLVGRTPQEKSRTFRGILSGPALEFENCTFRVTVATTPPTLGQQLVTSLLAQNATSVALPIMR